VVETRTLLKDDARRSSFLMRRRRVRATLFLAALSLLVTETS